MIQRECNIFLMENKINSLTLKNLTFFVILFVFTLHDPLNSFPAISGRFSVFLVCCGCKCPVALHHGAVGWSAVCDTCADRDGGQDPPGKSQKYRVS